MDTESKKVCMKAQDRKRVPSKCNVISRLKKDEVAAK